MCVFDTLFFVRCCEKTMELMHAHHEVILTILQVLLYDPLYAWTISPIKAYQLQHRHAADPDITDPNMNTTAVDLLDSSYRRQPSEYSKGKTDPDVVEHLSPQFC